MAVLLFKYLIILLLKMNTVYLSWGQSGAVVSICGGPWDWRGWACLLRLLGLLMCLYIRLLLVPAGEGAACGSSVAVAAKGVAWKFLYPLPRNWNLWGQVKSWVEKWGVGRDELPLLLTKGRGEQRRPFTFLFFSFFFRGVGAGKIWQEWEFRNTCIFSLSFATDIIVVRLTFMSTMIKSKGKSWRCNRLECINRN